MNYKTLSEVTRLISRGITPSYTDRDGIVVFNQKCIRNSVISLEPARYHNVNKKSIPPEKMLYQYDILVNSTGVGTLGRTAQLLHPAVKATVDSHVTIVRPSEAIDPFFLGYAIKWREPEIEALSEGSTGQTELSRVRLGQEITVPIFDIISQRKIGIILRLLDDEIELNNQINENLLQQAQALYRHLCDNCSFNKLVSLADLMDYAGGSQPPASEFIFEEKEGYVRFVQIRDYDTDSHITFIPVSPRNKLCEEHDIMIARYGASLGRICSGINGAYNVALAKVFPKQAYYREFLRCYLSSRSFYEGINNKGGRSAQAGFNQSDIKSFELRLPPKNDLINFEKIASSIFEQRLNLKRENRNLALLRDTILPKLMSGELDVSNLDL